MAKIKTEAAFKALSPADQLKVAKHPANKSILTSVRAQVMPHARFSGLSDVQLVQLVEAALIFDIAVTVD